jgi:hypothetical protein
MAKTQWDRFEPAQTDDWPEQVNDKLKQLDVRLGILARVAEQQIDTLNNKVSRLQADNDLLRQALESSEGFNAIAIDKSRVDATLRVGMDMEKIGFGYEEFFNPGSDPYVRVYPGEIQIADNTPVTLAQTDVSITADDSYVYLRYAYATGALTVQVDTAKPVSDKDYFKKWLCRVGLTGSSATIEEYGHLGGNITIPAIFKPT